jgi:hypothetical protein
MLLFGSQYDYNPNEDYATELKLREHLQSFIETVKSFNTIYTKVNFCAVHSTFPCCIFCIKVLLSL